MYLNIWATFSSHNFKKIAQSGHTAERQNNERFFSKIFNENIFYRKNLKNTHFGLQMVRE